VAVIESEFKFIEIAVEMLHGKLMIGTNDRTLEKTPNVLKRVGVRQTSHVFTPAVVNPNMNRVVVANSVIALLLVSAGYFRLFCKFRLDKSAKQRRARGEKFKSGHYPSLRSLLPWKTGAARMLHLVRD
jgi:ribosomal protein S3